jgi:hypothetical protein
MSSADVENSLFGFVAKNPGDKRYFTHVFVLRKQRHAEEVRSSSPDSTLCNGAHPGAHMVLKAAGPGNHEQGFPHGFQ